MGLFILSKAPIVWLTGATSLLGQEILNQWHQQYPNVHFMLMGRNPQKLERLKSQYGKAIVQTIALDILQADEQMLREVVPNRLPHYIVHAVGGAVEGDGHPLNWNRVEEAMKLNVALPILTEQVINRWRVRTDTQPLTIVHISSAATELGNAAPAYVMAKSALEAWTKNTAHYYTDPHLSIFAVQPGPLLGERGHWANAKQSKTPAYQSKMQLRQQRPLPSYQSTAQAIVQMATQTPELFHGHVINMSGSVLT